MYNYRYTALGGDSMDNANIVMYTVKDLRDIFKCSLTVAYNLANSNGFPSIRVGGKIMVEKQALKQWLEKNRGRHVLV